MTKVPTARDFIIANKDRFESTSVHIWLIEFARLHVKAALKAASINTKLDITENEEFCIDSTYSGYSGVYDDEVYIIPNKDSIINAYPESLIQ